MPFSRFSKTSLVLGVVSVIGCGGPADTTGSGGSGATGGSTTSTSTTGGGGTGGTGATGGGGSVMCEPGSTQSCYGGPDGTEGVGLCKAGVQTCKANGEGFGACTGEVLPATEICETAGDDDCDGQANEDGPDCTCLPGEVKDCYSAPPETKDVGPCTGGTQVCNENGDGYGPCTGEVGPVAETCNTLEDDDCDGLMNEEGDGCICVPGTHVSCYTGPMGTEGVGDCAPGTALCSEDGTMLGACTGQVLPAVETCITGGDEDCDGEANEEGPGCACTPGEMVPCYTGPMGTLGIGICKGGNQICNAQGVPEGPCTGEVTPGTETCATPGDDDCDGQVNEDGVGCSCTPGAVTSCYSGPAGTVGVGTCVAGMHTCNPDGGSYGPCVGEVVPAVENCNTAANEDCTATVDCGTQYWAKSFGSPGDQQAYAITRDAQDNAIFTGRFNGTMTFGGNMLISPNGYDIFVTKFDTAGNFLWSDRFGDSSIYQEGFDVAVDSSGNVFATGYFDGTINFGGQSFATGGVTDIWLVKLDPDGNHLWSKAFPAPSPQYGASLAVDPQGNVVLLANGFGTVNFGGGGLTSAGNYDIFVAKFDGVTGNHLWSKRYGSPTDDRGLNVATDSAGNIVVVGRSEGTLDYGAGAVPGNGGLDVIVVKLDPMGNHVWNKRFGDGGNQFGIDVTIDGSNNVILAGGFESTINLGGGAFQSAGDIDMFLAKLSPQGAHIWSKKYGAGAAVLSIMGLTVDSAGDVTAVGSLDGTVDFGAGPLTSTMGADAVVLHVAAGTGNLLWGRLYGGAGSQYLASVAADSSKDLLLTGYYEQTINFGGATLTSGGTLDIPLAKIAP